MSSLDNHDNFGNARPLWRQMKGQASGVSKVSRRVPARTGSPAFSLIELLVVMAIIAILASLLLPALSRAKGTAHGTRCIGNLRQFQLATALYVADFSAYPAYHEFLSYTRTGTINPSTANADMDQRRWSDKLHPYIGAHRTKSVHVCPGNPAEMMAAGRYRGLEVASGFHYDMNAVGVGFGGSDLGFSISEVINNVGVFRSCKESDIVHPGEMIAYGDTVPGRFLWDFSHQAFFAPSTVNPPGGNTQEEFRTKKHRDQIVARRHNGKWNVVFADGHVETHRTNVLFGTRRRIPEEEPMRRRWNRDNLPHWEELK